jgi:hypothetical protein
MLIGCSPSRPGRKPSSSYDPSGRARFPSASTHPRPRGRASRMASPTFSAPNLRRGSPAGRPRSASRQSNTRPVPPRSSPAGVSSRISSAGSPREFLPAFRARRQMACHQRSRARPVRDAVQLHGVQAHARRDVFHFVSRRIDEHADAQHVGRQVAYDSPRLFLARRTACCPARNSGRWRRARLRPPPARPRPT